jgi:hypothetical protein
MHACVIMHQDTEAGDLFAKKSRWGELHRAFWSREVQFEHMISLWRTAIQTVEGKHGALGFLNSLFTLHNRASELLFASSSPPGAGQDMLCKLPTACMRLASS